MICIKTEIPNQICGIDDELKATYHRMIPFAFGFSNLEKIEIIL